MIRFFLFRIWASIRDSIRLILKLKIRFDSWFDSSIFILRFDRVEIGFRVFPLALFRMCSRVRRWFGNLLWFTKSESFPAEKYDSVLVRPNRFPNHMIQKIIVTESRIRILRILSIRPNHESESQIKKVWIRITNH